MESTYQRKITVILRLDANEAEWLHRYMQNGRPNETLEDSTQRQAFFAATTIPEKETP